MKNTGKKIMKKKNNKKKEKQKKVTPSDETENAAEKEGKRLERQRTNKERKKERRALAERNNNLLDQMNAFANGSEIDEDPFTSDVVRECGQLNTSSSEFEEADNIPDPTPVTPQNRGSIRQLERTITELQSVSPRQKITIQQLQDTLASFCICIQRVYFFRVYWVYEMCIISILFPHVSY